MRAWLKLNPDKETEARRFLAGLVLEVGEACIVSISEILDAEPGVHASRSRGAGMKCGGGAALWGKNLLIAQKESD